MKLKFETFWPGRNWNHPDVVDDIRKQAFANLFYNLRGGKLSEARRKTSEVVLQRLVPTEVTHTHTHVVTWQAIEAAKARAAALTVPVVQQIEASQAVAIPLEAPKDSTTAETTAAPAPDKR